MYEPQQSKVAYFFSGHRGEMHTFKYSQKCNFWSRDFSLDRVSNWTECRPALYIIVLNLKVCSLILASSFYVINK